MMRPDLAVVMLVAACGALPANAEERAFDLERALRDAAPGSIVVVPAGVYRGGVLLDRPLTLSGEPGAVLDGGGDGDILRVIAPDVTVRGLTLRNTGSSLDKENAAITVLAPRVTVEDNILEDVLFGIYFKEAPDGIIRRNRIGGKQLAVQRRGDAIRLWSSHGVTIEQNEIRRSRDVVVWFSSRVELRGNRVRDGRYGMHFMYSDNNIIEHNDLRDNSVGAFLMYSKRLTFRHNTLADNRGPSGYGLGLKDMDGVEAHDNLILGNRVGIYLDNSPSRVDIVDRWERNVLAYNDIGVSFQPSVRRNEFVDNAFLENIEQVAVLDAGALIGNLFTADGRGNYWSDYQGYDLDGDGVGDLPYRPVSLFENLMDRHPKLRLFLYSPAQQAVELAARAFPAMRPTPKLEDSAPRMAPHDIARVEPAGASEAGMVLAGLSLLAGAAVLMAAGRRAGGGKSGVEAPAMTAGSMKMTEMRPMLRVRGLTKRYGRFKAVDDLSFDLLRGEALALWGRNGAGKTTVIRSVLGLHRHRGLIEVDGIDLDRDGKGVRRRVGYVPQELALYDDLSALETLQFFGRLKRVAALRPERVLEEVGLVEHGAKRVSELSGGMKQRLALAVALLADPPLLVLDEMTSNLDADGRSGFLGLLRRLREVGKTVLFITHRLDEVEALADRVLVLERGRVKLDCCPGVLAESLGLSSRLKLVVGEGSRDRAMEVLRSSGYAVKSNGVGFWVQVRPDAKIDPIERLLAADVPLVDFELGGEREPGPMEG